MGDRVRGAGMSVEVHRAPFYLGLDLGGTNIKAGVVDDDGRIASAIRLPTAADRGPDHGIARLAEAARLAVDRAGLAWREIAAVGLGSPGTMDIDAGMLLEPPNLPGWNDLPIRDRLAEALDRPVVFQNDANCAAYGESWAGAGRGVATLALFTLGTGVGGGLVIDGKIHQGRNSHGAEFGHLIVQMENGREHPPGCYGRLEAYASATAMVARAIEALERGQWTTLRKRLAARDLTARAIDEEAKAGDPVARRLMRETARYLAVGAVNVMHAIDPDLVLFGGGMVAAGPKFLDDIRADVRSMAFPIPAARTRIDYAALGADAGFLGAAGWARHQSAAGPAPTETAPRSTRPRE